ncbi:aldehyde dehydrogenase family protein [Sorangium sp. So ce1153]
MALGDQDSGGDEGRASTGAGEAARGVADDVRAGGLADAGARVGVRKAYKMFVGGAFVRSESGRYTQVRDQGGAGAVENIPRASRKDGRDAVLAAAGALGGWSSRSAFNRGQILYRLAEMLEARRAELAASLERGGLDAVAAEREVLSSIDRAVAYAGWADKYQSLFASLNPVAGPHFTFTVPEPMGVVVIAAPPRPALLGLASSLLPVITAGNTCVVLASEADPRTALIFSEALATSDLPGGVVNILTGQLAEVLPHLAAHMEVAALDLHGVDASLARRLEEAAAATVKRVRARSLDEAAWFDDRAATSPRWIERFVEMKTIWHPAGP